MHPKGYKNQIKMGKSLFNGNYITIEDWETGFPKIVIDKGTKFECINVIHHPHSRSECSIKIITGKHKGVVINILHNAFCYSPFISIGKHNDFNKESFEYIVKNELRNSYCVLGYYNEGVFNANNRGLIKQYPTGASSSGFIDRINDFCFYTQKTWGSRDDEGHIGAALLLNELKNILGVVYGISCSFEKIGSHESCGWQLNDEKNPSLPCGSVYCMTYKSKSVREQEKDQVKSPKKQLLGKKKRR